MLEPDCKEHDDFEYIKLADVGHASSDIKQKTATYKLIVDFLDRTA